MNELLLIDMMSELKPELLQDDYIEKDIKREKKPFYKLIFSFKKTLKQPYEFPMDNSLSEEPCNMDKEIEVTEDIKTTESLDETGEWEDEENRWGFNISIFEKKFRNLFKIISGIAATVIVVISIIVIILRRHKGGIKMHREKIQIIY
ncbi:MAG: hypothetical protein WCD89_20560 [Anaerocolumna sp.]